MTALVSRTPLQSMARATGLGVVLLHLVLAGLLWRMPAWGDRLAAVPAQQPLLVRLWWAPPPPPPATPPLRVDGPRVPSPKQPANPRPTEPQAITDPGAAAVGAVTEAPAAAATASALPSGPTQPAPLNLTLPRAASAPWRQRNPALDDPRANTARQTMEQKLANAMGGDGSWVMERVDLNTIRYRRGNECVQLIRSRAGQLELGGGAFRNSWLAGNC